jgi:hypothetical protein
MLNVAVVLNAIRTVDGFSDYLSENHPSIKSDIRTFKSNPRCKCRKSIIEYVKSMSESDSKSIISTWGGVINKLNVDDLSVPTVEEHKIDVPSEVEQHVERRTRNLERPSLPRNVLQGDVFEIPPEPQAFKDLITELRKDSHWRSFDVVVSEKDGKKVWLVFFA